MLEQRHLMIWKHRLTLEGNYHAVCWASLVFDHSLCALYWASLKASWAFSSCRGRCCLVKSRNPGQDSQDWPSSSHHILQDYQSRNSHSLDITKKIIMFVALKTRSQALLCKDQEKCLLLKTALGLFSWTSCFTLIRGSLWLTLVIVALELDYQSEKCQIMAMSIWCPMMTSSMMTVQKGQ